MAYLIIECPPWFASHCCRDRGRFSCKESLGSQKMTCCEDCMTCRLKQPTRRQGDTRVVKITWVTNFTIGYSRTILSKRNVQGQQLEAELVRGLSMKTRMPNKATTHRPPKPARTPIAQTGNLKRLPGLGVPETKPLPFGTGSFLGLGSADPAGSMIVAFL